MYNSGVGKTCKSQVRNAEIIFKKDFVRADQEEIFAVQIIATQISLSL